MVKARMTRSSSGECEIECRDHAAGSAQVCAAVSGIMAALAGYLQNSSATVSILDMRKGYNRLVFSGADEAFKMAVIGLMQIEKSYPEYIETMFCDLKTGGGEI